MTRRSAAVSRDKPGQAKTRLDERLGAALDRPWLAPILLAGVTVAVFARTVGFPLYNSDDNLYVLEDPRLAALTIGNAWKIFTTSFLANYHPLTTLTYAMDRLVWGR